MEVQDALSFAPGGYIADVKLARILPTLEDAPYFASGDFADDNHLPTVLGLMSETRRREAEKAEDWRVVGKKHGEVYCDLVSSDDE